MNTFAYATDRWRQRGAFLKFLSLDDCRSELRKQVRFAIAQFCCRQQACYWSAITIFHGRLAGGTTPFILRYSTSCP